MNAIQMIQLFNMNLEYPIEGLSLEAHTNYLINKQMNDFVKDFEEFKDRLFVIDYKDDLISLICYRIIKNLQEVCPFKFNIAIYGKSFHTRKELVKKEKRITKWGLNRRIKKNEVVIISPNNPLYKVANTEIKFKKFNCPIWKPLNKFTPEQIKEAQIFFHLGYFKKDKIQIDEDERIKKFSSFCKREDNDLFDFPIKIEYNKDIILLKLSGEIENDQLLLNEVEDFDGLVFYFYDGEDFPQMLKSDYSLYLKRKANIPFKGNINNYDIPRDLAARSTINSEFKGNWY